MHLIYLLVKLLHQYVQMQKYLDKLKLYLLSIALSIYLNQKNQQIF